MSDRGIDRGLFADSQAPRSIAPAVWVIGFITVYLYLIRDVELGRPYAFGDFPPYLGREALSLFGSTWHDWLLGYPHLYPTHVGYVGAVTLVGERLVAIGGFDPMTGAVLAQNIFFLSLIPAAFATFAIFAGRFIHDPAARYLAAGVYALNPITVGKFVNGGAGEFLAVVGIPLVLHYLWRVTETDEWRPALLAGVVFGAVAVIPWTALWLLAPFALFLCYRERRRPTVLVKFAVAGSVGVVLALPSVYYVLQRATSLDATGMMFSHLAWNYREATTLSVVRLAGNHGSFAMTELGYNSDPAMMVGLVIPVVALFAWSNRRLRFLYAIALPILAFIVLTHHGITYPLFEAMPPLWSLRNPLKLQYPLSLSICLLFGGGLQTLFDEVHGGILHGSRSRTGFDRLGYPDRGRWKRSIDEVSLARIALVGLVVLSLFSYVAPASDGALGMEETRGGEYVVPAEYDAVAAQLDGRVLWVPYSYTTQLRLRHAYPSHVGIKSGGIAQGKPNAAYVTELFSDIAADERVDDRLRALDVRYVVVDSRQQHRYPASVGEPRMEVRHSAPWLFGNPDTFATRLEHSPHYTREFTVDTLTVYSVGDAPERERFDRSRGVHWVVYPEQHTVRPLTENRVTNGQFAHGLDGWWTWSGENGTETTAIDTPDGQAALLRTESGRTYPIAQQLSVDKHYPYSLDVDVEGPATVSLFWYDGDRSAENETAVESHDVTELPGTHIARGDTLSVRVRPDDSRLVVHRVEVRRTTYPVETAFVPAAAGVPGVLVDGLEDLSTGSTVVGVNLDDAAIEQYDPDVRIVDAETVLDGELVFDDRYRQGVAVRLAGSDLPDAVPADAETVTYEDGDGTILDYWVVGTFDEQPVTILRTSYDERWIGPSEADHFRADGWANGFTNAEADEIVWTGYPYRNLVINVWLLGWTLVVGSLAGHAVWIRRAGLRRSIATRRTSPYGKDRL